MNQQSPWSAFEQSAPQLATHGRGLIERFGFVLLGTIRGDGTPRISPVEVHLVNGHLMLAMIPHTHKARDVQRDPRIVLQTPVTHAGDPGDELKLRGRAVEVDTEQREATADAIQASSGWRPESSWLFLSVVVEDAAYLGWEKGEMLLLRWDHERGLRRPERRRLDVPAGRYKPVEA
ncbi:MAG TPA: pyridoxamine 5'-phosphate oxidase family protein [Actinomycetes bacterium]|nr:pyridoxamine 5'-phosphate oxidase family protein [Actinomycetes bacterium]